MPEPTHHGWRRSPGGPWQKVCEGTASDCYQKLVTAHELTVGVPDGTEYAVLAAGVRPESQNYQTRDMRAWR